MTRARACSGAVRRWARAVAVLALGGAAGCTVDARSVTFKQLAGTGGGASLTNGGAGGQTDTELPPGCATTLPARELVTDFSDAVPLLMDDEGNPGLTFAVQDTVGGGQSFVYTAFGLTLPEVSIATSDAGNQAMRMTTEPLIPVSDRINFLGFGIGWSAVARDCLDASVYHGVSFTMAANIDHCELHVGVNTSVDEGIQYNAAGVCLLGDNCVPPQSPALDPTLTTVSVPFTDMHYGNPRDDVDPTQVIGINWQLLASVDGPACTADIVVDDVRFY